MKKDYDNSPEHGRSIASGISCVERRLFLQIDRLMHDEQVYRDPTLNRTRLARMVNSNSTYVGNSIRKTTGKQVNQYITECRLKAALKAIEQNPLVTTLSLIKECGFPSKSTFYRKFVAYYKITPKMCRSLYFRSGIEEEGDNKF